MSKLPQPNADELKNGWTAETLAAYRAERESNAAFHGNPEMHGDLVAGNVVTEHVRPRPAICLEGARGFNPHRW